MLEHHQIVASLQQQFDGKPNSHAVPAPVRTLLTRGRTMVSQTPMLFQLRSAHYSPEEEPCSETDTKTVRSLMVGMHLLSNTLS